MSNKILYCPQEGTIGFCGGRIGINGYCERCGCWLIQTNTVCTRIVPQPEPEESQKLYTLHEVKEILHNHHCDQFKLPRSTVFPEPNWTTEWIDKNLIQRKKQ